MAYRITEDCVKCGACFYECPQGAIYEGEKTYIINQDTCIQCGECATIYCPVWAIVSDESKESE